MEATLERSPPKGKNLRASINQLTCSNNIANPITIETIRDWLHSNGRDAHTSARGVAGRSCFRGQYTIEWSSAMLCNFYNSTSDVLLVSGEAGCGKNGLIDYLMEYARPDGPTAPIILSHVFGERNSFRFDLFRRILTMIESYNKCWNSPTTLIKRLLLQLFDCSLGHVPLYSSLCEAYDQIERQRIGEGDAMLWSILKEQFVQSRQPLLVIIDGLDQIEGGLATALRVRAQLRDVVSSRPESRYIILSRPIFKEPVPWMKDVPMDSAVIARDVRMYIEQEIRRLSAFCQYSAFEQETIIRKVREKTGHSFLEARLLTRYLELRTSYSDVIRCIGRIPSSLANLVDHLLLRVDFTDTKTVGLFSWLLVAESAFTSEQLEQVCGMRFQDFLAENSRTHG